MGAFNWLRNSAGVYDEMAGQGIARAAASGWWRE
jgi:hypothetical protein